MATGVAIGCFINTILFFPTYRAVWIGETVGFSAVAVVAYIFHRRSVT